MDSDNTDKVEKKVDKAQSAEVAQVAKGTEDGWMTRPTSIAFLSAAFEALDAQG